MESYQRINTASTPAPAPQFGPDGMIKTLPTLGRVRAALAGVADTVGKERGTGCLIIRREFFYTNGQTAAGFMAAVLAALGKAKIGAVPVDCWETWKAFRGGASTAKSSHWGVRLVLS